MSTSSATVAVLNHALLAGLPAARAQALRTALADVAIPAWMPQALWSRWEASRGRGWNLADYSAINPSFVAKMGTATRAQRAGVETFVVPPAGDRPQWDAALAEAIARHTPGLVVSAGFMRILGRAVLAGNRIINTHPALLPSVRDVDELRIAAEVESGRVDLAVVEDDANRRRRVPRVEFTYSARIPGGFHRSRQ